MVRTKHLLIFFAFLCGVLLVLVIYLLMGGKMQFGTEREDPTFVEEEQEYTVESQEKKDTKEAREALIAKLSEQGNEVVSEKGEEDIVEAENVLEEVIVDEDAASTSTAGSLPKIMLHLNGDTQAGTQGSYCWEGVCEMALIADLPYAAYPVSVLSDIAFSIDAAEQPEKVFIFLKELHATSTVFTRELSPTETTEGKITLNQVPGEYLLFITGVWSGGQDVSNAFKILMQ